MDFQQEDRSTRGNPEDYITTSNASMSPDNRPESESPSTQSIANSSVTGGGVSLGGGNSSGNGGNGTNGGGPSSNAGSTVSATGHSFRRYSDAAGSEVGRKKVALTVSRQRAARACEVSFSLSRTNDIPPPQPTWNADDWPYRLATQERFEAIRPRNPA